MIVDDNNILLRKDTLEQISEGIKGQHLSISGTVGYIKHYSHLIMYIENDSKKWL